MPILSLLLQACGPASVALDDGERAGSKPRRHDTGSEVDDTAHDSGVEDSGVGDSGSETGETAEPEPVIIAIDLVSPSTGLTTGGEPVTIYGGPFDETGTVLFGDAAATVTAWTSTTLSVTTPAHAREGTVDIIVETTTGRGVEQAGFAYVEPCTGIAPTPSTLSFTPANVSGEATIRLDGCATGLVAVDETYIDASGVEYGMTWSSVPPEVEGTATVTLRYTASRWTSTAYFTPTITTDQGTVAVSVYAGP